MPTAIFKFVTHSKKQQGYSAIELLVVFAVMVILFAILIPPLLNYSAELAEVERAANEEAIRKAIRQCYALEGRYPPVEGLNGLDYLEKNYQIILKQENYQYHYEILDGEPELTVEKRQK